jgi:hypothetical protein
MFSDPVLDLVKVQAQRMVEEGGERRTRRRYVAWGSAALSLDREASVALRLTIGFSGIRASS